MAQATSQRYSTRVLHSDGSQGSQPNLITVKDAARRLGVSKSTVYRFDREDGPFRFIVNGRPIFIENDSFETYLANTGRNRAELDTAADDVLPEGPQEDQPEQSDPRMGEMPSMASTPTPPVDVARSISSSGQRENILPRRDALAMFFYQSLIG